MFEDILEQMKRIEALDGTTHTSGKSKIVWHKLVQTHPTREAAMHASNADAIKKHKPLTPVRGLSDDDILNKAADKYVDDLIERLFDG